MHQFHDDNSSSSTFKVSAQLIDTICNLFLLIVYMCIVYARIVLIRKDFEFGLVLVLYRSLLFSLLIELYSKSISNVEWLSRVTFLFRVPIRFYWFFMCFYFCLHNVRGGGNGFVLIKNKLILKECAIFPVTSRVSITIRRKFDLILAVSMDL